MLKARRADIVALLMVVAALPAAAQSLGDLARQEEARRATAQKATRSLSNADLLPSDRVAAPGGETGAGAPCYMSISLGRCVSADELIASTKANVVSGERAKQEPRWRNMAADIREPLEARKRDAASLEAVAGDQRRSPGERAAAARAAGQTRDVVAALERQWRVFEKDAETHRIPRRWIEPIPTLSPQTPQ